MSPKMMYLTFLFLPGCVVSFRNMCGQVCKSSVNSLIRHQAHVTPTKSRNRTVAGSSSCLLAFLQSRHDSDI